MEIRPLATIALGSVLIVCPIRASAQVTGVSVQPASPSINQPATVTVTGKNPCGAVQINFGDAVITTYPVQTLPLSKAHTWATSGSKTVVATGQGNCAGQASTTVQVQDAATLGNLCKYIDCSGLLTPAITSHFGFATPGGIVAVIGKVFGSKPGSVVASLKTWNGGNLNKALKINAWANTLIEVEWPQDIAGVKFQTASLRVTTSWNSTSAPSAIEFYPELDFKTLPAADVTTVSCGTDSNGDACNGVRDPDDDGAFTPVASDSFNGSHHNVWAAIGNDADTDTFQISLKNDWAMSSFVWEVFVDPGAGSVNKPSGFSQTANWSPSIAWVVTPDDTVSYIGTVTISGPVGVPHK